MISLLLHTHTHTHTHTHKHTHTQTLTHTHKHTHTHAQIGKEFYLVRNIISYLNFNCSINSEISSLNSLSVTHTPTHNTRISIVRLQKSVELFIISPSITHLHTDTYIYDEVDTSGSRMPKG